MNVPAEPPEGNPGAGEQNDYRAGRSGRLDPPFTQRTVLILITALILGTVLGVLTYLAGNPVATAIAAGLGTAGATVPVLHVLIS
jgi:hypothetical protein